MSAHPADYSGTTLARNSASPGARVYSSKPLRRVPERTLSQRSTGATATVKASGASLRRKARWALVVLPSSLLALTGCYVFGPGVDRFVIHVESISAPDSIGGDDVLVVRFQGMIGPTLCYQFERVDSEVSASRLVIQFRGTEQKGRPCFLDPAHLDHEVQLPPPLEDPFTIRVLQPSGPALEKIVRIQQ